MRAAERVRSGVSGISAPPLSELPTEGVGATPGVWGVFSGGVIAVDGLGDEDEDEADLDLDESGALEDTLQRLVDREGSGEAQTLLAELPSLRVSAALEGQASARHVEDVIVRLARASTSDPSRCLLEHLPIGRRPSVTTLDELDRRNRLVRLAVSHGLTCDDTSIALHEVVVSRAMRGQGLGTSGAAGALSLRRRHRAQHRRVPRAWSRTAGRAGSAAGAMVCPAWI